ncbi:MAG: hypothetical protein KatS3mg060_1034 [Dehalococcoidia bacterium]|nr:MAG: hypothetical protein KatS3mg060_1034 [Dehalococcoidia bacterium]
MERISAWAAADRRVRDDNRVVEVAPDSRNPDLKGIDGRLTFHPNHQPGRGGWRDDDGARFLNEPVLDHLSRLGASRDRGQRTGRRGVVLRLVGSGGGGAGIHKRERPQLQSIAIAQGKRLASGETHAVHDRPVEAAKIDDDCRAVAASDLGMVTRHRRVWEENAVVFGAAKRRDLADQLMLSRLARGGCAR